MALRLSTALRNFLLQSGSLKGALQNGIMEIYSGSQPATPDSAVSGTLLSTITKASGARTAEVLATGTITLTGTTGGVATATVNSINIIPQGAVAFNTSLTQTAADLATAINKGLSSPEYTATSAGAVVTIKAMPGSGAGANSFAVSATYTGDMGGSYANLSAGVTAVNGLSFNNSAAGTLDKNDAETWTGVNVASGTAGWFRFKGSIADAGAADGTGVYIRMDGAIATSGAEYNVSSTTLTAAATHTVQTFPFIQPAS